MKPSRFLLVALASAGAALAQSQVTSSSFEQALESGKVSFNARLRYEHVDQAGLPEKANALTLRSRLGYTTAAYRGFQFMAEAENVVALADNYADGVTASPGYPVVGDPEVTEVNQAWASFATGKTKGTLGRQRLVLDNARFIGDVGWRQDMQTFDAFVLQDATVERLSLTYAYLWRINRVFADALDWDSDSHVAHASYAGFPLGTLTGYAYLLDFDSPAGARGSSTATYGASFAGSTPLNDSVKFAYRAEYATQSDYRSSPLDYRAAYYVLELGGVWKTFSLSVGREVLGSDNGQGFRTPLATLHAFNGWADVFLTTPAAGLRETYLKIAASLPAKLQFIGSLHRFEADRGNATYGNEIDLQLARRVNKRLNLTAKAALFDGKPGFADRDKYMVQADYAF
ncbi:MAG: alginate export family protein [Opitutaceae bacterium]|nr:alginate export family protein [Opitutaceae bacterium]